MKKTIKISAMILFIMTFSCAEKRSKNTAGVSGGDSSFAAEGSVRLDATNATLSTTGGPSSENNPVISASNIKGTKFTLFIIAATKAFPENGDESKLGDYLKTGSCLPISVDESGIGQINLQAGHYMIAGFPTIKFGLPSPIKNSIPECVGGTIYSGGINLPHWQFFEVSAGQTTVLAYPSYQDIQE